MLLAIAGSACGDIGTNPDAGDASLVDAGEAVAMRDARVLVDAAARDAAPDAGPNDPGWTHPSDLPTDCVYDIAAHPEAITVPGFLPYAWVSCGDGCRRTPTPALPVLDAFRVGGRIAVETANGHEIAPHWLEQERLVVDLDGGILAATRFQINGPNHLQPSCGTEHFAANGTDLGFEINYTRFDAAGETKLEAWIRTYRGTFDDLASTARRVSTYSFPAGLGGNPIAGIDLGAELVSYQYVGNNFASQPDGTAMVLDRTLMLRCGLPFDIGGDVLFAGAPLGGQGILARSIHGADATVLRDVAGGDILLFLSDGTTLAWMEGLGFDATTATWAAMSLWTGTYDSDTHTLSPTRLRDMSALTLTQYPAAGGGYYVQTEHGTIAGQDIYAIYRLSDGARAVFDPVAAGGSWAADITRLATSEELLFDTQGQLWRVDPRTLTFGE
jgi:hypothetical protein